MTNPYSDPVKAMAERNDAVDAIRQQRDSYKQQRDEARAKLAAAERQYAPDGEPLMTAKETALTIDHALREADLLGQLDAAQARAERAEAQCCDEDCHGARLGLEAKLTNALECREGYLKELERMSVVAYEREAKLAAAEADKDASDGAWTDALEASNALRDAAVARAERLQENIAALVRVTGTPGQDLASALARAERAEELGRSKCEVHFGQRTECGQCFSSLEQHFKNAQAQVRKLEDQRDEALAKLKAYENLNHVGPESEWFPTGYVAGLKAKLAALQRDQNHNDALMKCEAKLAAAEAARDFTYDQSVRREAGWSMEKSLFKQQRDAAVAGEKRWQEASNTDRALLQAQVAELAEAQAKVERLREALEGMFYVVMPWVVDTDDPDAVAAIKQARAALEGAKRMSVVAYEREAKQFETCNVQRDAALARAVRAEGLLELSPNAAIAQGVIPLKAAYAAVEGKQSRVAALTGALRVALEFMQDQVMSNSWGLVDKPREADRIAAVAHARSVLGDK